MREAFDTIFLWCEDAERRPATVAFYRGGQKIVEAEFGAATRVLSITVADVQAWVRRMKRRGNKPAPLRSRLRVLRRVFTVAGRQPVGPAQLVLPDVQEPDPRSSLTLEDVRALLSKLGPEDTLDPRHVLDGGLPGVDWRASIRGCGDAGG